MIEVIEGDLLFADTKYIAHQCNSISNKAVGLAKSIFDMFPYANTYKNRTEQSHLGSIQIMGAETNDRLIINMYAQCYPGSPKYPNSELDGFKAREKYFYQCLLKIAKIPNIESIAFPFNIGCGFGGGHWDYYYGTIKHFSQYIKETQNARTFIYKKD